MQKECFCLQSLRFSSCQSKTYLKGKIWCLIQLCMLLTTQWFISSLYKCRSLATKKYFSPYLIEELAVPSKHFCGLMNYAEWKWIVERDWKVISYTPIRLQYIFLLINCLWCHWKVISYTPLGLHYILLLINCLWCHFNGLQSGEK